MMRFNAAALVLIVTMGSGAAWAKSPSQKPVDTENEQRHFPDVYPLMYQILNEYSSLQRFVVSEKAFLAKENEAEIKARLETLSKLSSQVLRQKDLQVAAYRVSGEALDSHVQGMKRAYLEGDRKYARWMLASLPYACASCHTQLPNSPKPLWQLTSEEVKGPPAEQAEFLFATRNYGPAEEIFSSMIRKYRSQSLKNGNTFDTGELERAFKRKLTIWVRIRRDFKGAERSLGTDLKNKELPAYVRENVKSWIKQLRTLAKQKPPKNVKDLLDQVDQFIPSDTSGFSVGASNPDLVNLLYLSGLLYERLHTEPLGESTPELLYWLAVVDHGLNNEFFFSLGDTYLRECMNRFPTSAAAKRCYGEFEIRMTEAYTGTRGTEIPPEVQREMKKFRVKLGL